LRKKGGVHVTSKWTAKPKSGGVESLRGENELRPRKREEQKFTQDLFQNEKIESGVGVSGEEKGGREAAE